MWESGAVASMEVLLVVVLVVVLVSVMILHAPDFSYRVGRAFWSVLRVDLLEEPSRQSLQLFIFTIA